MVLNFGFVGFFNAKSILVEDQQRYYLLIAWSFKEVPTFPKGMYENERNRATRVLTHLLHDLNPTLVLMPGTLTKTNLTRS